LCIIVAVAFAFIHTGGDEGGGAQSVSFDSSTLNKFAENYLNFYQEGKIVKTHVEGYNATTGKHQTLSGTVIWVDDEKGSNVKVLIDVDGDSSPVLATLYKDIRDSDFYIESITLETSGEKYKNVTEIEVSPQNISTLNELTSKIGNNINYTISTTIAIDGKDSKTFQDVSNELFLNGRKQSIKPVSDSVYDQIALIMAGKNELSIASNIFGTINGKTDVITIRLYNSSPEEIKSIEKEFHVINVKKIS